MVKKTLFFFSLLVLNCSISSNKMPLNPIDDPPILPDKINKHILTHDKLSYQNIGYPGKLILPFVLSSIPSRGIGRNWEMPFVVLPFYRYLFGINDYYEVGKILEKKLYHSISFGLSDISYGQRNGLKLGFGIGYDIDYKINRILRHKLILLSKLISSRGINGSKISTQYVFKISLSPRTLFTIHPSIEYEYHDGVNYWSENFNQSILNEQLYFNIVKRINSYWEVGFEFGLEYIENEINYELYDRYYSNNFKWNIGTQLGLYW